MADQSLSESQFGGEGLRVVIKGELLGHLPQVLLQQVLRLALQQLELQGRLVSQVQEPQLLLLHLLLDLLVMLLVRHLLRLQLLVLLLLQAQVQALVPQPMQLQLRPRALSVGPNWHLVLKQPYAQVAEEEQALALQAQPLVALNQLPLTEY